MLIDFKDDLAASAFVANPSNDIDSLYEQYVSSLLDLLDIHAPLKTRRLAKPAPGWINNGFISVCEGNMNKLGGGTKPSEPCPS